MDGRNIAKWEQTQAEVEMRRWLIAHNLWAPESERAAIEPLAGEETAVRPAAALGTLLLGWPAVRRRLEAQIGARAQHEPPFYPYHAEMAITTFENALRQLAELALQLDDAPQTR